MPTAFRLLASVFFVFWLGKEVLLPAGAALWFSADYMRLVTQCDSAMESAWYGDQKDEAERKAQEIHLLDCHEYDKTRKALLISGLPEVYLSWLGLKALEIYQRPASELTKQHRFTER